VLPLTDRARSYTAKVTTMSARRSTKRTWLQAHKEQLSRGERAADAVRNGMGSWGFVSGFIAFMVVWALANVLTKGWDPYPFILLNLFLSMLAGLQGAILLIAAKRQDSITAALAQHDFDTNVAAKVDIEALMKVNATQLELIKELHAALVGGAGAVPDRDAGVG
jgi:uncharacterized membrane protein